MSKDEVFLPDLSGLNKKNSKSAKNSENAVSKKTEIMPEHLNKKALKKSEEPTNDIIKDISTNKPVANKVADEPITIANFLKNPVLPKFIDETPENDEKILDKFSSNGENISSLLSIRDKNKDKISIEELKKSIVIQEPMNIGQRILKIFK